MKAKMLDLLPFEPLTIASLGSMNVNQTKTLLSLLLIAGCCALTYYLVRGPGPKRARAIQTAMGKALGEQAATLATSGSRIVLVTPDLALSENPYAAHRVQGLIKALAQKSLAIAMTN